MLVIHLQSPDEHEFSYVQLGSQASAVWKRGHWGEVSRLAQHEQVVLLIPTRDVLLLEATLVTSNARQLKQALPYALEDSLIGDPVEQHFVWQAHKDNPSQLEVAVISRETLKQWMAVLKKHKIRVRTILPAVFAVPIAEEGEHVLPSIIQHDEHVLVRTGHLSGFSATSDTAGLLLDGLFEEGDKARKVWLYSDLPASWQQSLQVVRQPDPNTLLAASIEQGMALNLLNGYQDASMSNFTRHWKRWRVAAIFALITLGMLFAIQVMEVRQLQYQLAAEEQVNLAMFQQAFPEIKNADARSLRSRVQSEIKLLQQASGQTDAGKPSLLPYMATVAKTFEKEKQLKITGVRSQRGDLEIRFDSPSIELLEKLGRNLGETLGFEPQIRSTLSGGTVRAVLTLETTS